MPSIYNAVGLLWNGERPDARAIEDTMASYFNNLQGFLLLSHGSTVGAGPTLSSSIQASVRAVVDSSFMLMKESVSLYGDLPLYNISRTCPLSLSLSLSHTHTHTCLYPAQWCNYFIPIFVWSQSHPKLVS